MGHRGDLIPPVDGTEASVRPVESRRRRQSSSRGTYADFGTPYTRARRIAFPYSPICFARNRFLGIARHVPSHEYSAPGTGVASRLPSQRIEGYHTHHLPATFPCCVEGRWPSFHRYIFA